jgi:nitrate reductase gamma subunit
MTDGFVFVVAPYLSGAAAMSVCAVRYLIAAARGAAAPAAPALPERGVVRCVWRGAIGALAMGHLLSFVAPETVLRWNQLPTRLLLAEVAGLTAGVAALAALAAIGTRAMRTPRAMRSPFDVIAWTLCLTALATGLGVALAYRWASSWSAVTVAHYVQSLLRLEPQTILVQRLPLLPRLHIFVAFALLAVAPFTTRARLVIEVVDAARRRAAAVIARAGATAARTLDAWLIQLQPLRARLMGSDGEEN